MRIRFLIVESGEQVMVLRCIRYFQVNTVCFGHGHLHQALLDLVPNLD